MMRVLLDTHAFLWFVLDDPQLSPTALATIEDPANDVFVSPASFWEIAIKVSLRKLDLYTPYDEFMSRGIVDNDFEILPIEPRHGGRVTTLPFHQKDPFDRMIVAQALVEGIQVVSIDSVLDLYGVDRLW
jgi:PIN domain nuclease of toxin-antitoxin system